MREVLSPESSGFVPCDPELVSLARYLQFEVLGWTPAWGGGTQGLAVRQAQPPCRSEVGPEGKRPPRRRTEEVVWDKPLLTEGAGLMLLGPRVWSGAGSGCCPRQGSSRERDAHPRLPPPRGWWFPCNWSSWQPSTNSFLHLSFSFSLLSLPFISLPFLFLYFPLSLFLSPSSSEFLFLPPLSQSLSVSEPFLPIPAPHSLAPLPLSISASQLTITVSSFILRTHPPPHLTTGCWS